LELRALDRRDVADAAAFAILRVVLDVDSRSARSVSEPDAAGDFFTPFLTTPVFFTTPEGDFRTVAVVRTVGVDRLSIPEVGRFTTRLDGLLVGLAFFSRLVPEERRTFFRFGESSAGVSSIEEPSISS
jgi:hypothetical protein